MPPLRATRSSLAVACATLLACATPPASGDGASARRPIPRANAAEVRAMSTVQGLIIGTVVGGCIAGVPGAAGGAALFGAYGLVTGKPFYEGPNRHRGGTRDAVLEREVEEEIEAEEAASGSEPAAAPAPPSADSDSLLEVADTAR
jgi:hypothetical protein